MKSTVTSIDNNKVFSFLDLSLLKRLYYFSDTFYILEIFYKYSLTKDLSTNVNNFYINYNCKQ